MNKFVTVEQVKRWIADLRSGAYVQSLRRLRTCNSEGKAIGYCCMGVFLNAIAPEDLGNWCAIENVRTDIGFEFNELGLFDMPTSDPRWPRRGSQDVPVQQSLPAAFYIMNDAAKFSFAEIADWAEANLLPRLVALEASGEAEGGGS